MYSYDWDKETGGYLLNSSASMLSKEPRPVYYQELDLLGFDKYWKYAKDDSFPYMWAELNSYFYRGKLVAKVKGGALYTAPEIVICEEAEPAGTALQFVDIKAMVQKNSVIMDIVENDTIKRVFNTYVQHKKKVDVFYVAFSGGKDSIVLFDIVKEALPHNSFKVVFGDTDMEFPTTIKVAKEISFRWTSIYFLKAHKK